MKIRQKTLIITGLSVAIVLIGLYLMVYMLMSESVASIETSNLVNIAYDAKMRLGDESMQVDRTLGDWATWDDTYNFMQEPGADYIRSNLEDASLAAANIDIIGFYNVEGTAILLKMVKTGAAAPPPTPQELISPEADAPFLVAKNELANSSAENHAHGLMVVDERLTAVAAQPILTSKGEGPTHGTLLMGKYISHATISRLGGANNSNLDIEAWLMTDNMPQDARFAIAELLKSGDEVLVKNLDTKYHAAYSVVMDLYGRPVAVLRIERGRTERAQFETSMYYMMVAFTVIAVFFELLNFVLLNRFVLSRLNELEDQAEVIGKSDRHPKRISLKNPKDEDEISQLAVNINRMLARLSATQDELLRGHINYNRQLHREVKQKTRLLENANMRLKRVEKMKNRFLFSIGHELKSPLSVIEMNMAAIMSGKESPRQLQDSQMMINRNMLLLKQKIEEIIQLSSFEQSRAMKKERLDFCEIARGSVGVYRDFARVKNAKIHAACSTKHVMVMGDRRLLQYALDNLLSNAVKHCNSRDIHVKVWQEKGYVFFSVADNGPGIKPENRQKLFQRFFKEDPNGPGTGVGLFITREIAHGHSGSVVYRPNKPNGAVFIFSIPTKQEGG